MPDYVLLIVIMVIAAILLRLGSIYGQRKEHDKNPQYFPARMNILAQSHCTLKLIETGEIFELGRGDTLTLRGFQLVESVQVVADMNIDVDIGDL